jgi:hypothetical protein
VTLKDKDNQIEYSNTICWLLAHRARTSAVAVAVVAIAGAAIAGLDLVAVPVLVWSVESATA